MNDILSTLFLDNPEIPGHVYAFCNQLPDFLQAEREYETAAAALRARLGNDYDDFEETLNWYLAQFANAYYLFGLGLRQEVLSALGLAG